MHSTKKKKNPPTKPKISTRKQPCISSKLTVWLMTWNRKIEIKNFSRSSASLKYLNNRALLGAAIARRHIFLNPPLNQSHLVEMCYLKIKKVQIRRVYWQNHRYLFLHKFFGAQSEVARFSFKIFSSHDILQV